MRKMVDKVVLLCILLLVIFSLSCCNNEEFEDAKNETISETKISPAMNTTNGELYLAAEKELKEFFEYYNIDFNSFENRGLITISEYRYIFFENMSEEKYSFYVDIDNNNTIYGGYPDSGMDCWWINGQPSDENNVWYGNVEVLEPENPIMDMPYVSIHMDILGRSLNTYYNQIGGAFMEKNSQAELAPFVVEKVDGIRYYYVTKNQFLIGVDDGEISLVQGHTSTNQVRDVINSLGCTELFEVYPAVCKINNHNITRTLFCWQIENGYIALLVSGNESINNPYNCFAQSFMIFNDWSFFNVV